MARTKGTLNLSGTLEVKAGGPLDARSLVPTLADLTTAANFPYPYVGMETYVVAENKKYRLIATPVTSSSNWEEVGSGGGGGEDGGKMLTGTLLAASWSSKAQTVSVTGLKSDTIGAIGILNTATAAQVEAAREAVITPTTLANGTISFTCENVPSVDIPFGVMIPGGGSGGGEITVDSELSATSENPVQNKVITTELGKKVSFTPNATTSDMKDSDVVEVYCNRQSESSPWEGFRLITFANIKATLKTYFDTLYSTVKTRGTPASGGTALSLVTTGDMYNWNNPGIPVVANQFDKADIYSTTEKIVGCWIDGRPIYQKVVDCGALPANTNKNVAHGISNLGTVIKGYLICKHATSGVQISVPFVSATSTDANICFRVNSTDIIITDAIDNYATAFPSSYAILQYTKTTDAANSFKYADENDYSTTEHIVGKWIDGKQVYQKTLYKANFNAQWDDIADGIANMGVIVSVKTKVSVKDSNGSWTSMEMVPYPEIGNNKHVAYFVNPSNTQNNNIGFYMNDTNYSNYKDGVITVQYTKTTD